jgi:hypothetical protein
MLVLNKYFYKNNKSKLLGDRVAVLNDFIYQTGGSTPDLKFRPSLVGGDPNDALQRDI